MTFDQATLSPTANPDAFALATRARVESGRGRYDCGEIVFADSSEINLVEGWATLNGFAKLCRCSPAPAI